MNNVITVQQIKMAHCNGLFNLRNNPDVYRWFKNPKSISQQEHKSWLKNIVKLDSDLHLVALILDLCIGVAHLSEVSPHYISISVDPRYQNQKIGSILLDTLITNARFRSIPKVYAEINRNNRGSLALFQKHGFKKIPFMADGAGKGFEIFELSLS